MDCGLSPFRLGAPRDTPISTSWHTVENYNVKYYATDFNFRQAHQRWSQAQQAAHCYFIGIIVGRLALPTLNATKLHTTL
jgi:hypothetical protein